LNYPNNIKVLIILDLPAQEHLKFSLSSMNAVDQGRNSAAVYADLEYDVTEKWLINGAPLRELF
jgi:iron complex outermembrane receptor protein